MLEVHRMLDVPVSWPHSPEWMVMFHSMSKGASTRDEAERIAELPGWQEGYVFIQTL